MENILVHETEHILPPRLVISAYKDHITLTLDSTRYNLEYVIPVEMLERILREIQQDQEADDGQKTCERYLRRGVEWDGK